MLLRCRLAGLHSLPAELLQDIALRKAEAESMQLVFDERSEYVGSGVCKQRQVVLERAMSSGAVTVTWRSRRFKTRDQAVRWNRSNSTVYVRARQPLVLDTLHLALEKVEILASGAGPRCTVSFWMGGHALPDVSLLAEEFQPEEVDFLTANDRELAAKETAWHVTQRETALAHPTVARMLRILCDNSAL